MWSKTGPTESLLNEGARHLEYIFGRFRHFSTFRLHQVSPPTPSSLHLIYVWSPPKPGGGVEKRGNVQQDRWYASSQSDPDEYTRHAAAHAKPAKLTLTRCALAAPRRELRISHWQQIGK